VFVIFNIAGYGVEVTVMVTDTSVATDVNVGAVTTGAAVVNVGIARVVDVPVLAIS